MTEHFPAVVMALSQKVGLTPMKWREENNLIIIIFTTGQKMKFEREPEPTPLDKTIYPLDMKTTPASARPGLIARAHPSPTPEKEINLPTITPGAVATDPGRLATKGGQCNLSKCNYSSNCTWTPKWTASYCTGPITLTNNENIEHYNWTTYVEKPGKVTMQNI